MGLRARYFKPHEFACRCCGEVKMDQAFVTKLDNLRHEFGSPLVVTSGYRCPEHNAAVNGGPAHPSGKAVDVAIRGADARELVWRAIGAGFTGVGVQQKGARRFIHLDTLEDSPSAPRPWLWSY